MGGAEPAAELHTMLVPKNVRIQIYQHLFNSGVMVAKKDVNKAKHDDPELPVRNLYVIKILQSFKSKGFVTETFNWGWYYWYLTNEGITHLREVLGLPEECVPNTLKKSNRPASVRGEEGDRERRGGKGEGGWGGKGDSGWGGKGKGGGGYRTDFEGGKGGK